ncbi:MAG: cell division protein PerM, partial [Actinomycetes bacterium]
ALRPSSGRSAAPEPARPGAQPLSLIVGGAAGALWAALVGLLSVVVVVLVAWATDPRSASSASEALRTAGQVWLVAHGESLTLRDGVLGLTPLGLTVPLGLLLARAGRGLAESVALTGWGGHLAATLALAVPYGMLAAGVAGVTATEASRPGPWHALGGALILAAVAGGVGVARDTDGLDRRALPVWVRAQGRGVAGALGVLVGAGSLVVAVSLALQIETAGQLWRALQPGLVGGVLLLVLCVALLPNLVMWSVGFVVGPGFAVGTGSSVSPFGVDVGPVPAFPLLAVLPPPGVLPSWAPVVLVAPVAAGIVAGLLAERSAPSRHRHGALLRALAVGAWTGLVVALLAYVAGGPLGGGDLAVLGSPVALTGLATAVEVSLGAAVAAVWRTHRARRTLRPWA